MGYTHYWRKETEIAPATMSAIVEDFNRLVLPLHDNGLPLAGPLGEGQPEITPELVAFNGLAKCGHPKNTEIVIPWPTPEGAGLESNTTAQVGNWFAGAKIDARCCDGSCDYESFVFERVQPIRKGLSDGGDGRVFDCCKTAFRPYDIAVTAFLLVAKHRLGNLIEVTTDGADANWFDAKMLCQTVLGYGLEYEVKGDTVQPVDGEPPYTPKPKPAKVKPVRIQTHPPENIRRNALRKLAAIITRIQEATCYSLDDGFRGRPCDLDYIKRELREYPTARTRLRDNGNGTYTLHVHSNLWFEIAEAGVR